MDLVQERKSSAGYMFFTDISSHYQNCDFCNANLQNSIFDCTELRWDTPPSDNFIEIDQDIMVEMPAGNFRETDLTGVSFRKCQFHNADFRDSFRIEQADFSGAKGLETCVFDTEELKTRIIAQAKENTT